MIYVAGVGVYGKNRYPRARFFYQKIIYFHVCFKDKIQPINVKEKDECFRHDSKKSKGRRRGGDGRGGGGGDGDGGSWYSPVNEKKKKKNCHAEHPLSITQND